MAVATASLYLASSTGAVAGMAGCAAVIQGMVRYGLDRRLTASGYTDSAKWKVRCQLSLTYKKRILTTISPQIIERAVSDIHYIDNAKPRVARAVVSSYIEALTWTHGTPSLLILVLFANVVNRPLTSIFSHRILRHHVHSTA